MTLYKNLKSFGLKSKLPNGMYKGYRISWVIDQDPTYLIWMYKRKHIRLSGTAITRLMWVLNERGLK